MFDVAPTELLLVLVVALVIIGPKDLPKAMRFVGKWVGKARGMARHFRSGLDTMMREAELEELEKQWRQQNEEIMRQFPSDTSDGSTKAVTSSGHGMTGDDAAGADGAAENPGANPDFDAAGQGSAAAGNVMDAGVDADLPPETHQVPPRGSELP